MKYLLIFSKVCFGLLIALMLLVLVAELNYNEAVGYATSSEGTDEAIEQRMLQHGFDVEALDIQPMPLSSKIEALFYIKF